eukprot:5102217-Karenia_brevis.AAC.1
MRSYWQGLWGAGWLWHVIIRVGPSASGCSPVLALALVVCMRSGVSGFSPAVALACKFSTLVQMLHGLPWAGLLPS